MPFGATPFGYDAFGETIETPTVKYEPVPPPAAVFFDVGARDAALDEFGRFVGMDPIDQQVAISFAVARKSVKHAPEVGHDFRDLLNVSPAQLQATAERMASEATPFDKLIASRAVKLLGVEVQRPKKGEVRPIIKYKKSGETRVRRVTVGTG